MSERVTLPPDDMAAAAVYLAVLAFPERTDWRDDFLRAVMAAHTQPRINGRRIAAIDRVSKRIAERMEAVALVRPVLARAGLSRTGVTLQLTDRTGAYAPTLYGVARRNELREGPNVLGRAWKRSLPVLHMAVAFANHAPNGRSVLHLIREPSWVRPAVTGSRVFAAAIGEHIPTAGDLVEVADA